MQHPTQIVNREGGCEMSHGCLHQRLVKRQILHLTLHKIWFEKIAIGEKVEEYRTQSAHWKKRLEGKSYDEIHFRNGYAKEAPQMCVECLGITTGEWEGQPCYILKLGKILEIRRLKKTELQLLPAKNLVTLKRNSQYLTPK